MKISEKWDDAKGYFCVSSLKSKPRGEGTTSDQLRKCLGIVRAFGSNVFFVCVNESQVKYLYDLAEYLVNDINRNGTSFPPLSLNNHLSRVYIEDLVSGGSIRFVSNSGCVESKLRGLRINHIEIDHYSVSTMSSEQFDVLRQVRVIEPETEDAKVIEGIAP